MSEPTAPIMRTVMGELGEDAEPRESRWQATNWLPPLPPGPVWKEVAVRVSPAWGRRGVTVMRSVFREPITMMDIFEIERGGASGWEERLGGEGGGGLVVSV